MDIKNYNFRRPEPKRLRIASITTAEAVLQSLLNAHRDRALGEWLTKHPHFSLWLTQNLLRPVLGSAADTLKCDADHALAVACLLRWAVIQMRPDRAGTPIGREDWLSRTSWRPMLSAMCHYGFQPVQAFRDRYHAQADEAAASQLCGLWSVGPSTYYRYLEKAKRALAVTLRVGVLDGAQKLSLRALVLDDVVARAKFENKAALQSWHAAQVPRLLAAGDAASALWHQFQTTDINAFTKLLQEAATELANDDETDSLIAAVAVESISDPQRFDLLLAQAGLWRIRGQADREQAAIDQALRIAASVDDALMLGRAYGALGKFHEPRDADRALAFYQDCTDQLWRAGVGADSAPDTDLALVEEFVVALVRTAWSHVLRNDPRSKAALERAQSLSTRHGLATPVVAMLEQTWGEFWRRSGDLPRALEHKLRALNLYERAHDKSSILKTYSNLSLMYGEAKDFARAVEYSRRVLDMAQTTAVEPELVASTRLNLGVNFFFQGDHAAARVEYELALDVSMRNQLRLIARRAHYNLAEVAYLQFKQTADPADEQRGDMHSEQALAVWSHESDPTHAQAIKKLKGEILGNDANHVANRMAPPEAVLHPDELAEIQIQRDLLAVPSLPEPHVRAHLRIANAYLAVAMKEREAALALMQRHGLDHKFEAEMHALQTTFERELTHEQRLLRLWTEQASDLLSADRTKSLLGHLMHAGAVNKSSYAELCTLSPATASKHLGTLTLRGLLTKTGNGPSTRYVLATSSASATDA